ncbi:MAG: mechanosensitive ion channel [Desulfobacter sp.]|nr:MAG: mechanosensitive ion channel [Desulfobacter sp.]
MALGLQDSITTITVYVIWMFGILISMHVFGLNTASLAVAFGALGIGLGFGLQNIFNNFISGIILLFERPIQVGDDVEVNGIWAQVKKINVRSTVVQTYDNASLIIPNADFISNQVTNWSFKDKRIRRNIDVGVAYGSDVELVRETLLEIARNTPRVLGYPVPDVLFRDFGDSALIFRLRIWTDIDNMLRVETNIRFRIDKLFRERKIEISFPQRDIHIRSIADSPGENPKSESGKNIPGIEVGS